MTPEEAENFHEEDEDPAKFFAMFDTGIKKLDFSEFHPLDHNVWECRDYPGGRRCHLQYRWDFQWRDKLYGMTLCRIGKHDWAQWYYGRQREPFMRCNGCGRRKDA